MNRNEIAWKWNRLLCLFYELYRCRYSTWVLFAIKCMHEEEGSLRNDHTQHWTIASGNRWMREEEKIIHSTGSVLFLQLSFHRRSWITIFFVVVFSSPFQFPIFYAYTCKPESFSCITEHSILRGFFFFVPSIFEWKPMLKTAQNKKYSHWTIQYVHVQIVENDLFIWVLRIAIVFVATSYFDGSHYSVSLYFGCDKIYDRKIRWFPSQAGPSVARARPHTLSQNI